MRFPPAPSQLHQSHHHQLTRVFYFEFRRLMSRDLRHQDKYTNFHQTKNPFIKMAKMGRVLVIAGSDSSGGAFVPPSLTFPTNPFPQC